MSQSTLTAFSAEPTEKPSVYDCQNCDLFRGFVAGPRVACMGQLKEIPAKGCSCWSDGKDLEAMQQFGPPEGYLPKKWAGGRA